jgi:hypothetical protein
MCPIEQDAKPLKDLASHFEDKIHHLPHSILGGFVCLARLGRMSWQCQPRQWQEATRRVFRRTRDCQVRKLLLEQGGQLR